MFAWKKKRHWIELAAEWLYSTFFMMCLLFMIKNQSFLKKKIFSKFFIVNLVYRGLVKTKIHFKQSVPQYRQIFSWKLEILPHFQEIGGRNWESERALKHKWKTSYFQMSFCASLSLIMMLIYVNIFCYKGKKSYCTILPGSLTTDVLEYIYYSMIFSIGNKRWWHISLVLCHRDLWNTWMWSWVLCILFFFVSKDSQIILTWMKICWNNPPKYEKNHEKLIILMK